MGYVNEFFKVYNNNNYQILEKSSLFFCSGVRNFFFVCHDTMNGMRTCDVVEKFFPAACLAIETDKRENILVDSLVFFDAECVLRRLNN